MAGPLQLTELKKGRRMLIAPSLLSADALDVGGHIERLEGEADWLHGSRARPTGSTST